jgi:hypothetical protein
MPERAALDDEETARVALAERACQETSAGRTIPVGALPPKPRKTPSANGRLSLQACAARWPASTASRCVSAPPAVPCAPVSRSLPC